MEVQEAVRRALVEEKMLLGTDAVVCAFSGGADSLCLADVLLSLSSELGFRLECAHFNHFLRGGESLRDERFAAEWCASRDIKLHIGCGDAAAYASEHRMGIEEAARALRYGFLETLGDESTRIATAHQADDQAETMLLNLLRGSGLKGLCGIPPVRGRIIRPLLGVNRAQILAYLRQRGLTWVEDSSNQDTGFRRNLLRNRVMPLLREINPSFSENCVRTARLMRADEALLAEMAAKAVTTEGDRTVLSVPELRDLPLPLSSRAVRQALGVFGLQPEEKHVAAIMGLIVSKNPSAQMELPCGLAARRQYDRLLIGRDTGSSPVSETDLPFDEWTMIQAPALQVFWGSPSESLKINGKFTTYFFKKEQIRGIMKVRSRREGDRLQLPGRPGKSLKKWMIQEKIPASERDRLPVFADDDGVVAVFGLGADVRAAASKETADSVLVIVEMT